MLVIKKELIIDLEFQNLIEPLTPEEFAQLESNILECGCLNPLIVWANHNILIDGHNRLDICRKWNIEYEVKEVELDTRQDVINWIIDNQLGRRNLTPEQQSYLRGKRYNLEKSQHGGDRKSESKGKSFPLISTADKLAEQYKVSDRTIKNDAKFACAVDTIAAAVGDDVRRDLLSKDSKLTRQDTGKLADLAEHNPEQAKAVMSAIRGGEGGTPKQVIERAFIETALAEPQEECEELDLKAAHKSRVAEQLLQSPPPFPEGRYSTIVIDPPWAYECRQDDSTHRGRLTYPSMSLGEIIALPVPDLAEETCVLWLWTTNSFMSDAFKCLEAWGFTHKTILTWVKNQFGLGDWLRNQTEHCLVAVRGKPQSFSRAGRLENQATVLYANRREHSRKPDEFYERYVAVLCPGSKLEMFAREERPGWTCWGAEINYFSSDN